VHWRVVPFGLLYAALSAAIIAVDLSLVLLCKPFELLGRGAVWLHGVIMEPLSEAHRRLTCYAAVLVINNGARRRKRCRARAECTCAEDVCLRYDPEEKVS
jgi:hypothetical protein